MDAFFWLSIDDACDTERQSEVAAFWGKCCHNLCMHVLLMRSADFAHENALLYLGLKSGNIKFLTDHMLHDAIFSMKLDITAIFAFCKFRCATVSHWEYTEVTFLTLILNRSMNLSMLAITLRARGYDEKRSRMSVSSNVV